MAPEMTRLARGSMPWPVRLDGRPLATRRLVAAIQSSTGAISIYRRFYKPALGPVGDSLDDFQ